MKKNRLILALLTISSIVLGCALPGMVGIVPVEEGMNTSNRAKLVSAPSDATATPTPYQPMAPTPTFIPTDYPTTAPTSTPIPAAENTEGDPSRAGELPISEYRVNILLLGSDQRPYRGGFRTDTIIMLSLDPKVGSASLISFPRDLYVYIPGWTYQRINTAQARGGFPLLADTLAYNFGVRPENYVMINFWAFVQVIDNLGGIDVQVAKSISDHRDGYGYYTIPAGLVHMDGQTALWYTRARYTTSDFDRNRRQQEVLQAIFERLLRFDVIERAPELYDIYAQNVTTDLTLSDITPLLPLARLMADTSRIHHYFIGPGYVNSWVTPGGAQVLLPKTEAIIGLLWEAMSSP